VDAVVNYLLGALVPLILRITLFVLVFRFRRHRVPFLTSFLLAASPMLLSLIPIPLPEILLVIGGMGITLFFLNKYTEIDLLPEGSLIVVGIEIVGRVIMVVLRFALT